MGLVFQWISVWPCEKTASLRVEAWAVFPGVSGALPGCPGWAVAEPQRGQRGTHDGLSIPHLSAQFVPLGGASAAEGSSVYGGAAACAGVSEPTETINRPHLCAYGLPPSRGGI